MKLFSCCIRKLKQEVQPTPYTFVSNTKTIEPGWIYLIQEREFINSKENVFKIGKTKNLRYRMPSYPRNSLLFQCFYCETNIHEVEKYFIRHFDKVFTQRKDIGREYYYSEDRNNILKFFNRLSQEII